MFMDYLITVIMFKRNENGSIMISIPGLITGMFLFSWPNKSAVGQMQQAV
jgi:hypothetical protein